MSTSFTDDIEYRGDDEYLRESSHDRFRDQPIAHEDSSEESSQESCEDC
jgi:hypothetical protein